MAVSFCLKSRIVRRLLSVIMICSLLPGSLAWGALQPPLSKITNPVFGTSGGAVPTTVPPNLSPYITNVTAAIQLGKALFWDMQAGSDGVTACASCHYRAGADPVSAPVFDQITTHKRNKNQLNPGPDTIFGNNATVIRTQTINPLTKLPVVDPLTGLPVSVLLQATGLPQFAPNYTLNLAPFLGDFPLFNVIQPTSILILVDPVTGLPSVDPLTAVTTNPVTSISDTNDVVGSQGIRLADFLAINNNSALDSGTPVIDTIFHIGTSPNLNAGNNTRQVSGRNAPSVINAVFNYTNFWDGRANNIFNGSTPFGPLDQAASIWKDDNLSATLVPQKIAIPNSSLASQATGPALSDVEMSFRGRTFPELGRKMLSLTAPLGQQNVSPNDSILGALAITVAPAKGLNTNYTQMIQAAFQPSLWNSAKTVTLPTKAIPAGVAFKQIEANFSLFWGLAIQLYEATLVSDQAPFDRFQAGNQNTMTPSAQAGFTTFDGTCTVCHSGSEFTSAVVGSNTPICLTARLNDIVATNACNLMAFTNNSSHNLIQQEVNPTTFTASLTDTGFFNIGVRPTADDPGRGGSKLGFPLSFSKLAVQAAQTGLPFVTPKLPAGFPTTDKVLGSFKTPGLRNVELTAPYFHNGDALTLNQVVEFYVRGGNFPNNPELAVAMQPFKKLRGQLTKQFELVEFLKTLTDERVRKETAPFDHPELMIPNGVDANGADLLITLPATGGAAPPVPITTLTINPVTSPTNLTSLAISGTVDATATVAVVITNTTTGVSLPTLVATVGGTVAGVVGGVAQLPTDWSINLTGMLPGFYSITVTATSSTGGTKTLPLPNAPPVLFQITPTATIATSNGASLGVPTNLNSDTLTIGGAGVVAYQYSLDGGALNGVDLPVTQKIVFTRLADGSHTITVLGKAAGGNQQTIANATTATWIVKATPPVLTLNATGPPTSSNTMTISGTVELGPIPSVSVGTSSATVGPVKTVPGTGSGISTWSCDLTGLPSGITTITVTALDFVFNITTVTGPITRLPDGNFKGTGVTDISDALKAMRMAVKLVPATPLDLLHGDVAPLVNGIVVPDGKIDIADALLILRKVVGLVTF